MVILKGSVQYLAYVLVRCKLIGHSMTLDISLGYMALDVDPHEIGSWCIQQYSTTLKGFVSYTSRKERESYIYEVKHVIRIVYK